MIRKNILTTGEVYHVFNKSIAGYTVFNDEQDFFRISQMMMYYRSSETRIPFSGFLRLRDVKAKGFDACVNDCLDEKNKLVQIVAYCIMPTHLHLVLKQLKENGITKFIGNILNSYSRYFNTRHKRKGPLWVGPFKNVHVTTDEQLLHLTRYVHLNPVTASLVRKADEWQASSFHEYILDPTTKPRLCNYGGMIEMSSKEYKKFTEDGINYQKNMAKIQHLLLD